MEVSPKYIYKMVEDNDKNKYTTLYYLLLKRLDRGELQLEELQSSEEMVEKGNNRKENSRREKSAEKKFMVRDSVIKRRQNSKGREIRRNPSKNRSRYSSSKRSRDEPNELPNLKPNVTVKDITVEVKEKITINTTTFNNGNNRPVSPVSNNTPHYTKRNFYLSGRGYNPKSQSRGVTPHSNIGVKM